MNDYNIKDLFARLFVLAIQNKINFYSFTHHLERSEFVLKIEENEYDDYFNKDILTIFLISQIITFKVIQVMGYIMMPTGVDINILSYIKVCISHFRLYF